MVPVLQLKVERCTIGLYHYRKEVVVRKLNTYLTISKEMMEDADFVDNYINTHVAGRLLMQEDTQIFQWQQQRTELARY